LLAVDPADATSVVAACRGVGVDCAPIGRVTEASQGVTLATGGHGRPMPTFPQDQITRIFSEG
jgi:hydrogenase maturation factor